MKYLTIDQVLRLYRLIMEQTGGGVGLRDAAALDSALAQPRMTFGSEELYPTLIEKSAALGFSMIKNHPFVDGNKRIGYAAIKAFVLLNGHELSGDVDEWETTILRLAAGEIGREEFVNWLSRKVVPQRE